MVRHVRTSEGSSFFGLPIGSPISGRMIRTISAAAAQVGRHLDFSKTDHLSDNPISSGDIAKAQAKGFPTVNMGAHVPISTEPGVDHESMLNRLHPGTHIFHISHAGRAHEHVKAPEGHWNEVAPGTGKDMGYKASAKDLGTSLSTADSAHVTQVGKPLAESNSPAERARLLKQSQSEMQNFEAARRSGQNPFQAEDDKRAAHMKAETDRLRAEGEAADRAAQAGKLPSVAKQIASDPGEQKALKAWEARQSTEKAGGKSVIPATAKAPAKDDTSAERASFYKAKVANADAADKANNRASTPVKPAAAASPAGSPASKTLTDKFGDPKKWGTAGPEERAKNQAIREAAGARSEAKNSTVKPAPKSIHPEGKVLSRNDIANLPAGHLIHHSSGNRYISTGDGRITGVDQMGSFGKGDYSHDAGKGRMSYKGPIDPKNLPKSKINYHYAPKKSAATSDAWHAAAKKAFSGAN